MTTLLMQDLHWTFPNTDCTDWGFLWVSSVPPA